MPKSIGLDEFIKRSIEINGPEHYNYEKVDYVNTNTHVILYCNIHKIEFKQKPTLHIYQKCGCPLCAREQSTNSRLLGNEYYINKIIDKFGDIYDFSNVPINSTRKDKIKIICKECGNEFFSRFESLLKKERCLICHPIKKIILVSSLEEFINHCNNIHNFKYNYSKVQYVNNHSKVLIGCIKHNIWFEQMVSSHIIGLGCKLCANEETSKKLSSTFDYWLDLFLKVHGNNFDYSLSEFKGSKTPILIKCKNGHEFKQIPQKHANGAQCSFCLGRHKTKEQFIDEVSKLHDYFYTYNFVIYKNNHEKILVTCPIHGNFPISPTNHRKMRGCSICNSSRGEVQIKKFLKSKELKFEPQFRFNDCRNINPLPFDFCVLNEDSSVKFLIEYQGEQHFKPVTFNNISLEKAEYNLSQVQFRDNIKKEYCLKNGIPILYISYDEYERVEEILNLYISNF